MSQHRRQDTSVERLARRARQARRRRQQFRQRPVVTSAAAIERAGRRVAGGARRASVSARRRAYAYGSTYGPVVGQSMQRWARSRRDWLRAHDVRLDTSGLHRSLRGGLTGRRRVQLAAAQARRRVNRARGPVAQRMVRAAGLLNASDQPGARQLGRRVQRAADRVSPLRYRCPRCRASYRNSREWVQHECIQPSRWTWGYHSMPDNPDNPMHGVQPAPLPKSATPATSATSNRNSTGGSAMSTPTQSMSTSGGHPAQIIGKGGLALGNLQPATDQELIWTLERLNAACQMVGSGALSFAENLDVMGIDPRVVENMRAFSQHLSESAAFPLKTHQLFYALYGHRIEPGQGHARAVKVDKFFADTRS